MLHELEKSSLLSRVDTPTSKHSYKYALLQVDTPISRHIANHTKVTHDAGYGMQISNADYSWKIRERVE